MGVYAELFMKPFKGDAFTVGEDNEDHKKAATSPRRIYIPPTAGLY
jgi:hypothetical protein